MSRTLIRDAYILTLNARNDIFEKGSVIVEDDKINFVGKAERIKEKDGAFEKVIDAGSNIIMPGLIDTHVHLAQALLRSIVPDDVRLIEWLKNWVWPLQGSFDKEDGQVSAQLCMLEMLRSGTTAFVESLLHTRYGFDGIAGVALKSGMRAVLSKAVMDIPGYAGQKDVIHPGMVEDRDESLNEFKRMHAKWNGAGAGRIQVWLGPRTPGACSESLYRTVAQIAREYTAGVTMHLAEVKEDLEYFSSLKTSPGEFVNRLGLTGSRRIFAHCVWLSEDDMRVFAKTGTSVAHCPSSNMKLGSGIAPVSEMLRLGVNVCLGCDGGPSNDDYDMIREVKLAVLLQKGINLNPNALTAVEALRMATVNGAKALGLENQIGSIEVGKKADLIIVDPRRPHLFPNINPISNIVYSATGADVRSVMIDGKLVMEDNQVLTLDEDSILKAASDKAEKLLHKSGKR